MKNSLLAILIIATLTACATDKKEQEVDIQESIKEQDEDNKDGIIFENRYEDCTIETCSKEMLMERYYEVETTKDSYFGESVDIQQALVDLYGVGIEDLEEIEKVQGFIESDEELISDNNQFFDVQGYIDNVVRCEGQCQSKFIIYEEASSLSFDESLALVRENSKSYNVGSSSINSDVTTDSSSSTSSLSSLDNNGICKEVETKYTSQGLKVTSCIYTSSKEPISITVENNSGVDLSYLEVEIYGIDSNGKTISSDYTNHGSTIRNGASQTLQAYLNSYANSYEVEISKAIPK